VNVDRDGVADDGSMTSIIHYPKEFVGSITISPRRALLGTRQAVISPEFRRIPYKALESIVIPQSCPIVRA